MIYKGQELRAELRVSDDEDDSTTHVVSIVALSNARGFVCADALGKVHVFEQVVDEAASSAANAKVTKVKKLPPPNYVRTKTEVTVALTGVWVMVFSRRVFSLSACIHVFYLLSPKCAVDQNLSTQVGKEGHP